MPEPRPQIAASDLFAAVEQVIDGHTVPVYANGPVVLTELLDGTSAFGDKTFLIGPHNSYTYAEHYAKAEALATRMLGAYGLCRGDRVAIAMDNYPEWQIAFWAAQAAGLIVVPLNSSWSAPEMIAALEHCSPTLLVVDGARRLRVSGWLGARGAAPPRVLTVGHEPVENEPLALPEERLEDMPLVSGPAPPHTAAPDDIAAILYTSGTTGLPKGVAITHRNLCGAALNGRWASARAAIETGADKDALEPSTVLPAFPFSHVAAITVVLAAMTHGGTLVLLPEWDADAAQRAIARNRVTTFAGPPSTVLQLLDTAVPGAAPTALRRISTGGSAAPADLVRRIHDRYGGKVEAQNGYGLTETSGRVVSIGGKRYRDYPGCIGAPTPTTRVRIVGPDGTEAIEGQVGELQLMGQAVFSAYWNDAAATEAAFDHGWFHTGDLGYMRDGEIYLVDRASDVVVKAGEHVYCIEVESALFDHPDVAEAAMIGIPHPEVGEEVAAVVVPRPGTAIEPDMLRAHLAARLPESKLPAYVVVRGDALPRNASGKILKGRLRCELSAR
jgi:long-chain acyl-CoA synthetase